MKNTIPTAEEFYQSAINDNSIGDDITDLMNAYAKMHVEAALNAASEKAKTNVISEYEVIVDKSTIFNAYPLTNIK